MFQLNEDPNLKSKTAMYLSYFLSSENETKLRTWDWSSDGDFYMAILTWDRYYRPINVWSEKEIAYLYGSGAQ